jgi:AcrR family transcriptional regulator
MGITERKIREKESRIKVIQEAAKAIFFEKGFQAATMEEIAGEAEISKGTIYLYFRNKDDLYTSIIIEGMEQLRDTLIKFENDLGNGKFKNSEDLVMGFFQMDYEIYCKNPDSLRMHQSFKLNNIFSKLSKENIDLINETGRGNLKISRRIISRAIEMKLFPDLDPAQVIDVFRAVFLGNVQIGDKREMFTKKKNYSMENLKLSFLLISKGIEALSSTSAGLIKKK